MKNSTHFSLALWPHAFSVLRPDHRHLHISSDDKTRAALLERLISAKSDDVFSELLAEYDDGDFFDLPSSTSTTLERLTQLDEEELGWYPGLVANNSERVQKIRALHSENRIFEAPPHARPTLPLSTLLRALSIEKLAPQKVLIMDDADGLSLILQGVKETQVYTTSPHQRQWLQSLAEGSESHLPDFPETLPADQSSDLTVYTSSSEPLSSFRAALRATRPGGHLLISLRFPWEADFYPLLQKAGLSVKTYYRDTEQHLLPGLFLMEGGGDLLLVQIPDSWEMPKELSEAECLPGLPHAWHDVDHLDLDRPGAKDIDKIADSLTLMSGAKEAGRRIHKEKARTVLWWFGENKSAITIEVNEENKHIYAAISPWDANLEQAFFCATLWCMGSSTTRARPKRTLFSPDNQILG
ncbi:hypothetical protein KAI87_14310 [Myxococcota bacterium]|nr:hypothetical protein [Myxococcota bacterium]